MEDSQPNSKVFSVRIVSIDYYTTPPIPGFDISYSSFHGGKVKEVPVIRIYGSTPAGQKTCLHIHRVLPYLYIPCLDLGLTTTDEGAAGSYTNDISLALEKTLKLKGNAGLKRQHVHSCSLVRARKFYGYHSSEELFMKIYFYYPQDVSRAANLLLGGAIFGKVLQPYESHIPFLLQFLIDYNLYGMGHLHVSGIKFRNPLPDVFSEQKANHNSKLRQLADNSNSMTTDSQADLSGDTCFNLPIWISSTIPDGWIWLPESLENEDFPLFRRQSTSELEGDAVADEIMNQQCISYSPLSQTHSEVKMVQSLIPIWEEEFERTGGPSSMPPDSGKPGSHDVLRILSDGIELRKFMEVEDNGESCSTPNLPKSSVVCGNVTEFVNVEGNNYSPSNYLTASDRLGSLLSVDASLRTGGATDVNEVDAVGPEASSSAKVSDEDALRLLKWFASSQAVEDINSDEELAPETILSPLLPSKSIDKVLEKANADYESESQQECQDILDSVDVLTMEDLDGRTANVAEYKRSRDAFSNQIIPQVDGSSDDQPSTPFADKSIKVDDSETESPCAVRSWSKLRSSLISRDRRKRPRMGSLPISSQKVSNENEKKEKLGTFILWNEPSMLVECSTRDLMRRKRSHRIELSDPRSPVEEESCSDSECLKEDTNVGINLRNDIEENACVFPTSTEPPVTDEMTVCVDNNTSCTIESQDEGSRVKTIRPCIRTLGKLPLSSSKGSIVSGRAPNNTTVQSDQGNYRGCDIQHSSVNDDSNVGDTTCMLERGFRAVLPTNDVGLHRVPSDSDFSGPPSKNNCMVESECQSSSHICKGTAKQAEENETEETLLQFESTCNRGNQPSFTKPYNSMLESVSKEAKPYNLTGMTFYRKPPTIEFTDDSGSEVPGQPLGSAHDCLPFFMGNCLKEKEHDEVSPELGNFNDNQQSAMSVPVVYKNDGSYLFKLTPAVSPPSYKCVDRWLSLEKSGISAKCTCESTYKINLQNSQPDVSSSPTMEFVCSDVTPSLDESHHHRQESCSTEVKTHQETQEKPSTSRMPDISQLSGPDRKTRQTPLSQIGFRDPASVGGGQQLTLLSIEVQAESRGDLRPDPRFDAINVIVLVFQEDDGSSDDVHVLLRCDYARERDIDALSECKLFTFTKELDLLNHFTKVIQTVDPDVLMGWDVQSGSLGYLAERAVHLGIGLLNYISRTPFNYNVVSGDSEKERGIESISESVTAEAALKNAIIDDEWGRTHASGVHVGGRIVLNIWRLMRNEVKLNLYSAEAVAEAVLRRKIPSIPWKILSQWFRSGPGRARYRSIEYILDRAKLNLQIMTQLDMINRTSELARVFGIDFFSVLSRGSQYRVESMFLRLAHTQNYVAISPGNQQVASQPAMECIPLVMEPESNFYADPVIVLDFQSLYPSMVIAYNLCFCTCLGKITPGKTGVLGVSSYSPDINVLRGLKHELLVTPNGVAYVPSKIRKGILPRLLEEILSTRIMVKQAMKKLAPSQKVLSRIFNARQLALKLIANVTYGYTAAGFSGRMPCAELADSIVQCGRRTLETAISFVNSNDKWKARVVYGDTDSMFVLLKGRSVKEAFNIGREIASEVSQMNPDPITLKMEKVYSPCFLLTKKRYVGYSYESPDQLKPTFDAKGIETVRRDTCPAVSKTLEHALRVYFEHQHIDKVRAYLQRQWTKILSGRVSLQDFVFAKEVRLGTYSSRASSLPPAAIVATKAMRIDPRAEPRYAERIPYVVVHGEPGSRLVDMVVDPLDLLAVNSPFRLNDIYYIRKQIIPALQRVFGLVRADLNQWFLEMPRPAVKAVGPAQSVSSNPQRTRIDYYYLSKHCVICGDLVQSRAHLCSNCSKNESTVAVALVGRTSKLEKDIHHLAAICRHCGGGDWMVESGVKCTSLACSVFYERRKVQKELKSLCEVGSSIGFYPKCTVEWF